MEDILLFEDDQAGTTTLTTNSSQSSHGLPVLRIKAKGVNGDFGPADTIAPGLTAADIVAKWGSEKERTPEEKKAASDFLGQWNRGPQIHTEELKRVIIQWPESTDEAVRSIAFENRVSIAEVVRSAMALYLESLEE